MKLYQYNENDFRLKFLFNIKPLNSMDTQKHGNKKKLPIRKLSFFTCKLVIRDSLLTIKTKIKSHLHYIDIIAYHRT